ncbi:helix-turn-helix domain-containing protein [Streptomyces lydicus]|uniref:helix-turn-helix domain-containing protein n=1 Tax=Streptomyces lydicus TaxID=47763 RepID=UPI0037892B05
MKRNWNPADAERNRTRVLDAAREVFRARGDEAQMPEVARAAGVGIGTVYRHFPSRAALIAAVGEQRQAEIVEFGRSRCLPSARPRTSRANCSPAPRRRARYGRTPRSVMW